MDARRGQSRITNAAAENSPEKWARRLRSGEPDAVKNVRQRVGKILSFNRLGIPHQDRQDLEQEIMTEVWQAVNRSDFDLGAGFWGFVEVVTSRRCIDWLRARRERFPVVESLRDEGKNPCERVLDGERSEIASQILEALQPKCKKIIVMRLYEGSSYKEIAQILGQTEGALRVQLYRCIRSARDIVTRMDPGVWHGIGEGGPDGPS